jgi:hypothetical protein
VIRPKRAYNFGYNCVTNSLSLVESSLAPPYDVLGHAVLSDRSHHDGRWIEGAIVEDGPSNQQCVAGYDMAFAD